jgi:hypothetical protein
LSLSDFSYNINWGTWGQFHQPNGAKQECANIGILWHFSVSPTKIHPTLSAASTRIYSVFQGFRKAKSANGGSILSSSQFLILPQLPQKIKLAS